MFIQLHVICIFIEPAPGRLSFSNETAGPRSEASALNDLKIKGMQRKTIHTTRGLCCCLMFVRCFKLNPNPRLDQIRRLDVLDLKTQLKQI